jgi:uncharacterized protein HemX
MADEEKSAAEQVKEAAWTYTAWTLVLALTFGAGLFLGHQLWAAGENGQPQLLARTQKLEEDINRIKNERESCQKVLEVTRGRQSGLEKEIESLKAKAAAQ